VRYISRRRSRIGLKRRGWREPDLGFWRCTRRFVSDGADMRQSEARKERCAVDSPEMLVKRSMIRMTRYSISVKSDNLNIWLEDQSLWPDITSRRNLNSQHQLPISQLVASRSP